MMFSTLGIPAARGASQTDINSAIAKGLSYLSSTQNSDGSWSWEPVASTAMAVLAFENNGHYGWNTSDPDHTIVQNGLNWLFSDADVQTINGVNSAGNPDVSGDGIGIYWASDGEPVYETPMVLAAIVASNKQTDVTSMGPTGVTGRTYVAVAQDIVDWIAWAQNSKPGCCGVYEGGWRYGPQEGDSDNSVSQWPVMGLLAAQLWGVNAPSWVATELLKWVASDQELTGTPATNPTYGAFDYQPGRQLSPAETAAGILELTYAGVPDTDSRIQAAEGYLYSDWTPNGYSRDGEYGWNWNIGALYDMYAIMKAMRSTIPTPTVYIPNYAQTASIEWYNGAGQYADSLIANQGADGHWNNWVNWAEDISDNLATAWGVLILEFVPVRVTYTLQVDVVDNHGNPIPGASVTAVGPTTLNGVTDASGKVVFSGAQAGTYGVTASKTGYSSASQSVNLDMSKTITLTLLPSTTPVPEFPAPSFGLYLITVLLFSALLVTTRRFRRPVYHS